MLARQLRDTVGSLDTGIKDTWERREENRSADEKETTSSSLSLIWLSHHHATHLIINQGHKVSSVPAVRPIGRNRSGRDLPLIPSCLIRCG